MTKGPAPRPWKERFEPLFIPEPNSGCWLWLGGTTVSGYGQFSRSRSKMIGAHRAAWLIYRGAIPAGAHVLHDCDTKACVNPAHLHLGTHAENMAEAGARHRHQKGRKITPEIVRLIRASTALGRELRDLYGVSEGMVSMIRNRKAWERVV